MIKVAILDTNEMYLRRLHDYWSRKYGGAALMVYAFSSQAQLKEQMGREIFDVLLVNSAIEMDWEEVPPRTLKLYLLAGRTDGEVNGIPALAKNGNADELYDRVRSLYEEHMNIGRQILPGKLVFFTSADGGCGTSSCAIGYGKYLTAQGKNVLYLNFELVSAMEAMLDGEGGKCMDDLFYLCETSRKNVDRSMKSLTVADSSGLQYVAPCRNPIELKEKGREQISSLVSNVIEKGAYDVVVADRELELDEITETLFDMADAVVLVAENSESGRRKLKRTRHLLDEISRRGTNLTVKLRILYNKTDGMAGESPDTLGAIPDWSGLDERKITEQIGCWTGFEQILWKNKE